jgi:hypothetical protein
MPLTRSQRRARAKSRVANALRNPGRSALEPIARQGGELVHLNANPNRGKRDGAPLNHSARTLAPRALRGEPDYDRLMVATPLRTPTGRQAREGGAPLYSRYVIASDRRRVPRGKVTTTRP